ncbi:FAD/NAD(P)-binding protein [Nocardioides sp. AN3]
MSTEAYPIRVAVVGGGASGVLTAINLLARSDDPRLEVVIHEASGVVGRGVAYGTNDQRHLLNVRARHMSALADAPSDLLEWAMRTGRSDDPQGFLPRADYATYLQDRLTDVADDRLRIQAGRVLDIVPTGEATTFEIVTERTRSLADAVVLCHGNQAPRRLRTAGAGATIPDASWHLPNPWELGRLRTLPDDARVLVVGTGLTAVDTVITLLEEGPGRQVRMVSRGGRLPKPHVAQQHTSWVTKVPEGPLTADQLAAAVREECEAASRQGVGWRNVVDGLRPVAQDVWRRLLLEERRRFLAVYAGEWEVRRHRMAPEVALRLQRYRFEGRLTVETGTLHAVTDLGGRCAVATSADGPSLEVDAVVNCTGPHLDVATTTDPLLAALRERGLISSDPLGLGLATTVDGRLIGADGAVVDGLLTIGPARKGTLWESTAIPEIRAQAAAAALALTRRTRAVAA